MKDQTIRERKAQLRKMKEQSLVDVRYNSRADGYRSIETGVVLGVRDPGTSLDVWKFWFHPNFHTLGLPVMVRVGKDTPAVVVRTSDEYTVSEALAKVEASEFMNLNEVFNWERRSTHEHPNISVEVTDVRTRKRVKL